VINSNSAKFKLVTVLYYIQFKSRSHLCITIQLLCHFVVKCRIVNTNICIVSQLKIQLYVSIHRMLVIRYIKNQSANDIEFVKLQILYFAIAIVYERIIMNHFEYFHSYSVNIGIDPIKKIAFVEKF